MQYKKGTQAHPTGHTRRSASNDDASKTENPDCTGQAVANHALHSVLVSKDEK